MSKLISASSPFIGIDSSELIGKRKQHNYCIIATYRYDGQGNQFMIINVHIPGQRKKVVLDID